MTVAVRDEIGEIGGGVVGAMVVGFVVGLGVVVGGTLTSRVNVKLSDV